MTYFRMILSVFKDEVCHICTKITLDDLPLVCQWASDSNGLSLTIEMVEMLK